MEIVLDLAPDEETRLRAEADREGVELAECVRRLLARHLPRRNTGDATIDLLRSWREEDRTEDPDAAAQAEAELDEFKRRLNEPRRRAGARLLFP